MRIRPSWWIGVVVYLIYNAVIFGTWAAVGADYGNLVASDVILQRVVLPLALGAVVMVAALSWLGWWRPVMREERRGGPGWALWIVLLVVLGFIAVMAATTDWSALSAGHLALLVAAAVMVGFNEEALTRGVLVVGWRGSTSKEGWVWFCTVLLFGLMHLPNGFFGTGLIGGAIQTVFAFFGGTAFYVARRVSGTLLLPMALHGAWDFASFAHQASGVGMSPLTPYFQFGTYLVAIVLVVFVLSNDRRSEG